ncbi:MAG: carbohydrate-binding protein [Symbiopectobacterium sp.]|uniref:carbohydrate-binding protein n=1 Tax=Symbiopectobacterium sp. TaxID=2952789 RepID=UPI0039EA0912
MAGGRHWRWFYSAFDVNFGGSNEGGGGTQNPAPWSPNSVFYPVGVYVTHNGGIYRCRSAHTSNSGWAPGVAFTLWTYVRPIS